MMPGMTAQDEELTASLLREINRRRVAFFICLQDMANVVYIISGRRKSELEDWLGDVPRLVSPRARFRPRLWFCSIKLLLLAVLWV